MRDIKTTVMMSKSRTGTDKSNEINSDKVMSELLSLYDFHIRCIDFEDTHDYECGYADAIGQCILNLGRILGETGDRPYKYEAFKRVMQFENVSKYKRDYPEAYRG